LSNFHFSLNIELLSCNPIRKGCANNCTEQTRNQVKYRIWGYIHNSVAPTKFSTKFIITIINCQQPNL